MYANDFQHAVECTPRINADDTCLLIQNTKLEGLQNVADAEMDKILNWMVANKFTINPKKSSQKGALLCYVHANNNGHQINSCDKVTYLGIV